MNSLIIENKRLRFSSNVTVAEDSLRLPKTLIIHNSSLLFFKGRRLNFSKMWNINTSKGK